MPRVKLSERIKVLEQKLLGTEHKVKKEERKERKEKHEIVKLEHEEHKPRRTARKEKYSYSPEAPHRTRKLTAMNLFLQKEIPKMKSENPRERFKMAVEAWNRRKHKGKD